MSTSKSIKSSNKSSDKSSRSKKASKSPSKSKTNSKSKSAPKEKSKGTKYFQPFDTLKVLTGDELLGTKHRSTKKYWGRHITDGMLGMVYGRRGAGKTHFATALAVSMSTGKTFLDNKPEAPANVMILDGEMGTKLFKKRLAEAKKTLKVKSLKKLTIFSPDMFKHLMPSLATAEGQKAIDKIVPKEVDVIIVDNFSAWNRGGNENADGFGPWAEWLLQHKNLGRTVIFVHHANKAGGQRGSSRKEDGLDFVIRLEPQTDVDHPDALSFVLEWEKTRQESKNATKPIHVTRLDRKEKPPKWLHKSTLTSEDKLAKAIELQASGMTMEQIGNTMGVTKSTISRMLKGTKKKSI